ncbi:DNA-binding response regulator [uncultured Amnibacterium sp.]|uniref:DNA-binding response regulator n=1 Tax=uncultured Amnibacterium sp. TaxID=1631851 RepID=UPI0035CA4403
MSRDGTPHPGGSSSPVRFAVALVDDHEVIGLAVRSMLAPLQEIDLVGSARTVGDLLLRTTRRIDLVVLDLRLADGSDPVDNFTRLTAAGCDVLAYTSGESPSLLRAITRLDVLGIVRKSEHPSVLTRALLQAARNQPVVTTDWAVTVQSDPILPSARLTAHEARVLEAFADGRTARHVADLLQVAESTIEDSVNRIRAKYSRVGRPARSKVDLYKRAVEDGFLPLPTEAADGLSTPARLRSGVGGPRRGAAAGR